MRKKQILEAGQKKPTLGLVKNPNTTKRTSIDKLDVTVLSDNMMNEERLFEKMYNYTGRRLEDERSSSTEGVSMFGFSSKLLDTIKISGLEAVESTAPCSILFGKIISKAPLEIRVEQKLILVEKHLIIRENIRKLLDEDQLNTGESVILIRMQGGQQFLILDKIQTKNV